jgi:transposase-like protein
LLVINKKGGLAMSLVGAYYETLWEERRCPHCRQDMRRVKDANFVKSYRGDEKDLYRCDKCGVDVEVTSPPELLGFVVKVFKKALPYIGIGWDR